MGITIGVLAVQGAFIEHEQMLEQLGVQCVELRQAADLDRPFDGLVLPGGESTVQGKLLRELGMFDALRKRVQEGLPVLATCAGMILLAEEVVQGKGSGASSARDASVVRAEDDPGAAPYLATMPVTVCRNAYGRQLGSFFVEAPFEGAGVVPMTFIRAPYVERIGEGVRTLAEVDGHVVAVRYKNQIACSFHPELDASLEVHRAFLDMVADYLG